LLPDSKIPIKTTKGRISKTRNKAVQNRQGARKVKKAIQKCRTSRARAAPYAPPADAIIDPSVFGPADENEIRTNPLHYVHIRANEIWTASPALFNQTTACVSIMECGAGDAVTRSVLLTSCVEGPNPLAELRRQAKDSEVLVDPDPIVHRVRHNLTPDQRKRKAKKPKDTVFIARRSASSPAVSARLDQHRDYAAAQASMSRRVPPYTVTSLYPSDDPNETHAEQRAIAYAAARGCRVIAQAPTIGCCQECRNDLGDRINNVPAERQSSRAYNEYRRRILAPTRHHLNPPST